MKRRNAGAAGSWVGSVNEAAMPPLVRRTMNDVADGLLLDVREINISDSDFADADAGSALSRALERILNSNTCCNFNSFNSSI
jgi:hypothetical protein